VFRFSPSACRGVRHHPVPARNHITERDTWWLWAGVLLSIGATIDSMLLNKEEILKRLTLPATDPKILRIEPSSHQNVKDSFIDLRLAVHSVDDGRPIRYIGDWTVKPGTACTVQTMEEIRLPRDLMGLIELPPKQLYKGLMSEPRAVDAGYFGYLLFHIYNIGNAPVQFRSGSEVARLTLLKVTHRDDGEVVFEECRHGNGIVNIEAQLPHDGRVVEATAAFPRYMDEFHKDPARLFELTPRQFEEFVADIWRRQFGFEVELTAQTRDSGRDIIAVRRTDMLLRFLIECKRYAPERKVDIGIVRLATKIGERMPSLWS